MMKHLSYLALGFLALMCQPAMAVERSTEAEAMNLLRHAQEYIKKNGMEKAIQEFNRLDSRFNTKSDINRVGDLYLYTLDAKGYQSVHGKNPKIRGKVMIEMRDHDGVLLIKKMAEQCFGRQGKGRVHYRWPNPITGNVESKVGLVERIPGTDTCLGTGIYQ